MQRFDTVSGLSVDHRRLHERASRPGRCAHVPRPNEAGGCAQRRALAAFAQEESRDASDAGHLRLGEHQQKRCRRAKRSERRQRGALFVRLALLDARLRPLLPGAATSRVAALLAGVCIVKLFSDTNISLSIVAISQDKQQATHKTFQDKSIIYVLKISFVISDAIIANCITYLKTSVGSRMSHSVEST